MFHNELSLWTVGIDRNRLNQVIKTLEPRVKAKASKLGRNTINLQFSYHLLMTDHLFSRFS
jgi:hypothetical protein